MAQDKGGARSYYVDDPRGNLTQQLDGSRNVVAVYGYDPYGQERKGLTRSASASWESRLRFQTAPRDPKTGAYNIGPRLFDPGVNRFVGADSYLEAAADMDLALDPLTGNRYLYAGANPAGLIDDGHGPKKTPAPKCQRRTGRAPIVDYLTGKVCAPDGFVSRHYQPELRWTKAGWRMADPFGDRSAKGLRDTGRSFDFADACDTHDYGYDLLRYFGIGGPSRRAVDNLFEKDTRAACNDRGPFTFYTCRTWAAIYSTGVKAMSTVERYRPPSGTITSRDRRMSWLGMKE